MSRLYTLLMLFVGGILLLVFRSGEIRQLWNTQLTQTGHFYHQTFYRDARRNSPPELKELNGRLVRSNHNEVVYRFVAPQNSELYLQPTLVRQNSLKTRQNQIFSYKNLNVIELVFPQQLTRQTLFHVAQHPPQRIRLHPYLGKNTVFELVLKASQQGQPSERVLGSLDIYAVQQPVDNELPALPILALYLMAPVIWYALCQYGLGFSLSVSLGLPTCVLLLAHTLAIVKPELADTLLTASLLVSLAVLGLRSKWERQPLPAAAFGWGIIALALALRWQEILIQATRPLDSLPLSQAYYAHAVEMDLFSAKGFFSGEFAHGPLYPFLLKLAGTLFGFSPLHAYYVNLGLSVCLLLLIARMTQLLVGGNWRPLLVMLLVAVNPFLVQESALLQPDLMGACLALLYLLLVFSNLRPLWLYGLLRGAVLVCLIWTHLSFTPVVLLLLLLETFYQLRRQGGGWYWRKAWGAALLSGTLLLAGTLPLLLQNFKHFGSYLPESTAYVNRMANLSFADQPGYPSSLDVIRYGEDAENYRRLSIREYFLRAHQPQESLLAIGLGAVVIVLDSMGTVFHLAQGQNILEVLINGLSSRQNMLPLFALFLAEIFAALFLGVFTWLRYRRYRFLVLMLLVWLLPFVFFHGIFMLKGNALLQGTLDHQLLLLWTPVLCLILVDVLVWLGQNRSRWLQ